MKKNTSGLLVESVAIFLSVLLAFAAEQWRSDYNDRKRANDIMSLVRTELSQNLQELERVSGTRAEALEFYIDAIGVYNETGGFPPDFTEPVSPRITSVAYKLATESGAVSMVDPSNLIMIGRAYEALDQVASNVEFLDDRNAQVRFQDGEQYISGFIYYTNRATNNEPIAISEIRSALNAL